MKDSSLPPGPGSADLPVGQYARRIPTWFKARMRDSRPAATCFTRRRTLFCLAGLMLATAAARAQYDPDWSRHFRIGPMVGLNISADFKVNGNLAFHHAPGVFDDGYVLRDSTGNAGGVTTYFGYDNSSQYDSAANTLTMHQTTAFSGSSGASASSSGAFPGLDMAYGGNLWYWKRLRIGWDFGFGFLPINLSARTAATGTASQTTFTYDTTGQRLPQYDTNSRGMPPAIYQAPAGATGPYNIPSSPESTFTTNAPGASLSASQTLDVMLYTFRLGPSVFWDFNRHLGMSLAAGPALGIVSGDLKYDETIVLPGANPSRSRGSISATDLVYGGDVNVTLFYHVVRGGDLYLGAQYMPLTSAKISGGGREARLNLGGAVYISAGLNWPF